MSEDALWYEAATLAGIVNSLNVAADSLAPIVGSCLIEPAAEDDSNPRLQTIFADMRSFFACGEVPLVFRVLGSDPGYLHEYWAACRHAFSDNHLSRRLKAALAFAVSLTSRSTFGSRFYLNEMRRLGIGAEGVMEIVGVTLAFSSYTKIADILQLEPDMEHIAPSDPSPAPGGSERLTDNPSKMGISTPSKTT